MSQRLNKINQLLKEEIGRIIQKDIDDHRIGFVTVTRVITSADLHMAKVYISMIMMEEDKKKQAALKVINKASFYIKRLLADRIKLRYLPELKFFEDKSIDESLRIEELFRQIDEQKKKK